jgi:hypothetical protein
LPIALEEEYKPGLPVVKRTRLGEKFFGAIVKVEQRDRLKKDEATGQMVPVTKPGGKAKQELVVTCLTLPGTTAPAGIGDNESVPEEGDLVRLILRGKAFGDWIESKSQLGRPVQVGDIVSQKTDRAQVYDAHGNPSGDELTDQAAVDAVPRGRSVGIYGPVEVRAPKDGSPWVAKAEEAYHSLHEPIAAEEPHSSPVADDDEPPF